MLRNALDVDSLRIWLETYQSAGPSHRAAADSLVNRSTTSVLFWKLGTLSEYTGAHSRGAVVQLLITAGKPLGHIPEYYQRWCTLTKGDSNIDVTWDQLTLHAPADFIGEDWHEMGGQDDGEHSIH
jgi:hypothetical protein